MWKVFVLLVFPCQGFLLEKDLSTSSDLLDAADEIISANFKPNAVTINVILSLNDETKRNRSDLINNLVARCDVVLIEEVDSITHRQRLYNVILIEDFKSFLRLCPKLSSANFVIDGFFLLIAVKGSIPEIGEITKRLWKLLIHNAGILMTAENGTNLMTFFPFSKEQCDEGKCAKRCDDSTPHIVRNFNSTVTKKQEIFFPEKVSDMFQCPVKVVTFNTPPLMMIIYDSQRQFDLKGIDGEMLKVLSQILNFKIDLIHISDLIRWGALYENGTASGAMEMIVKNQADLTLGMYTITFLRSKFMTSSELYYSVPFVLIVPPGIPFSAFEKLFRPFKVEVWILLLFTFLVATCVVTFVKFQAISIRTFVFGANNTAPYLNILSVFVGVSMHLLPKRNFARNLLMMFLLFSIVKRTLYQGILFQFIQADDRHKEVQSIDELVQKDIKVHMLPSSIEHTQNMKFRDNRVVVNSSMLLKKRMETTNPYGNTAVSSSLEQILYYNKLNYKENTTLTVCKEYLFTFQYGIYFRKNSYLEQAFNKKIQLLKSSGLIDFWASEFINSRYLNIKTRDGSPKKLNMEQLLGGFEVLLIGLVVGFFVFLVEAISRWLRIARVQRVIEFFT